jgi:hypothetical protein
MTKKELSQIYYLNRELEMWQRELEKVQCESLIKCQQITDMPRGTGISDKTANRVASIDNIERIINGKLIEIQIQRERIMTYINSIDDSLLRQILFYRHISCMKWGQVAINIGGDNTGDSVRKMHDRFLEEN